MDHSGPNLQPPQDLVLCSTHCVRVPRVSMKFIPSSGLWACENSDACVSMMRLGCQSQQQQQMGFTLSGYGGMSAPPPLPTVTAAPGPSVGGDGGDDCDEALLLDLVLGNERIIMEKPTPPVLPSPAAAMQQPQQLYNGHSNQSSSSSSPHDAQSKLPLSTSADVAQSPTDSAALGPHQPIIAAPIGRVFPTVAANSSDYASSNPSSSYALIAGRGIQPPFVPPKTNGPPQAFKPMLPGQQAPGAQSTLLPQVIMSRVIQEQPVISSSTTTTLSIIPPPTARVAESSNEETSTQRGKRNRSPVKEERTKMLLASSSVLPPAAKAPVKQPALQPKIKMPIAAPSAATAGSAPRPSGPPRPPPLPPPPPPPLPPKAPVIIGSKSNGPRSSTSSSKNEVGLEVMDDAVRVPTAGGPVAGSGPIHKAPLVFTHTNFDVGSNSRIATSALERSKAAAGAQPTAVVASPESLVLYNPAAVAPSVLRESSNGSAVPKQPTPKVNQARRGIRWHSKTEFIDRESSARTKRMRQQQLVSSGSLPVGGAGGPRPAGAAANPSVIPSRISTRAKTAAQIQPAKVVAGTIDTVGPAFSDGQMGRFFYTGPRPKGPDDDSCVPRTPQWLLDMKKNNPRTCKTVRKLPANLFENSGPRMVGCCVSPDTYDTVGIRPFTELVPQQQQYEEVPGVEEDPLDDGVEDLEEFPELLLDDEDDDQDINTEEGEKDEDRVDSAVVTDNANPADAIAVDHDGDDTVRLKQGVVSIITDAGKEDGTNGEGLAEPVDSVDATLQPE